jgi:DNA-directed RNA polymerase specialized sigma subunit
MTGDADTELEALAAHARAHPPLPADAVDRMIEAAAGGDAAAQAGLVEQALEVVLDAALARRGLGVEIPDLYQEGSEAAVVAVHEYVGRRASGARLNGYVRRVVDGHLDRVVERERAAAIDASAMVRDVRLLEIAQVELRRRGGGPPSDTELAAALTWSTEKVGLVRGILDGARERFDAEIVQYLDDAEPEGDGTSGPGAG